MKLKLTSFDKVCLKKAILMAEAVYKKGINYPVAAVLAIDGNVVDVCGNSINQHESLVNHAENHLIIKNAKKLYKAAKTGKPVYLYSTLEPCIQCLGACVTNHIDKVFYITKDPHGGACDLKPKNIGLRYEEFWPEVIYAPISDKPRKIIVAHFKRQLKKRINIEWANKMLKLLD